MKIIDTAILIIFFSALAFAQDVKERATKFDQFTSKTGTTVKFIDYHLPDLELNYGAAESKVRKLISGNEARLFYVISKSGEYSTKTAAIAYDDLLEILKALNKLKMESSSDVASKPDYLENKFVTVDGFQIGYFVSKGKVQWYAVLDKYGSDNTLFLKNVSAIESAMSSAKSKIESLK
jgi:hypothetical protein